MTYRRDDRDRDHGSGASGSPKRRGRRRRICRFCADRALLIDYKDPQTLRYFITDRGRIVPRRISGTCAKHQRAVARAIKRARNIAIMPYGVTGG